MGGTHRQIRTGDGELLVEVRGEGPPLLCLHGLTANRSTWYALADHLEGRFTLYMPDLLSRGESAIRADLRYRLGDEARRVRELIRRLELRDFLVTGHSQGAAIAVAVAAPPFRPPTGAADRDTGSGPSLPSGLVLVNPVTPWSARPGVLDWLEPLPLTGAVASLLRVARQPVTRYILERRVFASRSAVSGEIVDRYAAPYADPERARALVRVLADWRPAELAEHLAVPLPPVRVLAGERDRRIAAGEIQRLAEQLGARLDLLAATGHALPEERPDAVARALLDLRPPPPEQRTPPEDSST